MELYLVQKHSDRRLHEHPPAFKPGVQGRHKRRTGIVLSSDASVSQYRASPAYTQILPSSSSQHLLISSASPDSSKAVFSVLLYIYLVTEIFIVSSDTTLHSPGSRQGESSVVQDSPSCSGQSLSKQRAHLEAIVHHF